MKPTMARSLARLLGCRSAILGIPVQHAAATPLAVRFGFATSGDEHKTVIDRIIDDHNTIRRVYEKFNERTNSNDDKQQLAYLLTHEIALHSANEEMVVYPVIHDALGDEAATTLLTGHQALKETLYELDSMRAGQPGFDQKELGDHLADKEVQLLPKLAISLPQERLEALGREFNSAAPFAPSRPHPSAPDKTPWNLPTNAATAPLDRLRDAFRFGTTDPVGKVLGGGQ